MKLTARDCELFDLLACCQFLTSTQATWACFESGKTERRRVGMYIKEGYFASFSSPYSFKQGRPEQIIHLSPKRLDEVLSVIGNGLTRADVVTRLPKESSLLFHLLSINDFRASLHRVCRDNGLGYEFIAEYEKGHSNNLERCLLQGAGHVPDAVFTLKSKEGKQSLFFLELDLGNEPIARSTRYGSDITSKFEAYQQCYVSRDFQEYNNRFSYTFKGFRVLVVTSSVRRLTNIAEKEDSKRIKGLVWLTTRDQIRPESLFSPIWTAPGFDHNPLSIVRSKGVEKCHVV